MTSDGKIFRSAKSALQPRATASLDLAADNIPPPARYLPGFDEIPGIRDDCFPVTKPPRVEDYVTHRFAASFPLNRRRAGLIL
jgi:hypothetical protein